MRDVIKYKRLETGMLVDKIKSFSKKMFGRLMQDTDPRHLDAEDWKIIQESTKLYEECLEFTGEYQTVINYQTELLEHLVNEMNDMKEELKRISK